MTHEDEPEERPPTKDWRRFLPTAGTLTLMVCLLAPTLLVGGGGGSTMTIDPDSGYELVTRTTRIGPGYATITTTVENGAESTQTDVGWLAVSVVLVSVFVFARALARRVELRRSKGTARMVLVGAPLMVVLLSVLVGGAASRWYWGYWYRRPGTSAFTRDVEEVTDLSFIRAVVGEDGTLETFVIDEDTSLADELEQLADDPYYALPARLLAPLAEDGRIPADVAPFDERALADLAADLRDLGKFATPSAGYEDFLENLHGVAMVVRGDVPWGEMIVGVSGGEVSNDHRPHDEFRWNFTSSGAPDRVLHQRFYYDLAGLEGMEWWVVSLLLGVAGALGCSLLALVAGSRRPRL